MVRVRKERETEKGEIEGDRGVAGKQGKREGKRGERTQIKGPRTTLGFSTKSGVEDKRKRQFC